MEQTLNAYNSFLKGDKQAFSQVVADFGEPLVRFACGFLKDYSLSEDVMMDVFASIIVTPRAFINERAFKAYLFRCARNNCIDKLRKSRKNLPLEFAENKETPTNLLPDEIVIKYDDGEKISAAIDKLPPQYRDVIYLVYYENFDITQTANILKKSKKQIYNILARSKQYLKNEVKYE